MSKRAARKWWSSYFCLSFVRERLDEESGWNLVTEQGRAGDLDAVRYAPGTGHAPTWAPGVCFPAELHTRTRFPPTFLIQREVFNRNCQVGPGRVLAMRTTSGVCVLSGHTTTRPQNRPSTAPPSPSTAHQASPSAQRPAQRDALRGKAIKAAAAASSSIAPLLWRPRGQPVPCNGRTSTAAEQSSGRSSPCFHSFTSFRSRGVRQAGPFGGEEKKKKRPLPCGR